MGKKSLNEIEEWLRNLGLQLWENHDQRSMRYLREHPAYYIAPQPAKQPLSDEELREALRQCPHDTVENLRVRWLYAKDFARAIEAAHGIKGETE